MRWSSILTRWMLSKNIVVTFVNKISEKLFLQNIPFKLILQGIMTNLRKWRKIYKLKYIPYQIYEQKVKPFKVTISTTESRFLINCGCKFTSSGHNFNTIWTIYFFQFPEKMTCQYDKNFGNLENALRKHSIW